MTERVALILCERHSMAREIHGHRGGKRTPTYNSWRKMRERVLNPHQDGYELYGGRGIRICRRWSSFKAFLTDMGERPAGKTLDRINPEGNYEPGNCRWATLSEQNQNRVFGRAA